MGLGITDLESGRIGRGVDGCDLLAEPDDAANLLADGLGQPRHAADDFIEIAAPIAGRAPDADRQARFPNLLQALQDAHEIESAHRVDIVRQVFKIRLRVDLAASQVFAWVGVVELK